MGFGRFKGLWGPKNLTWDYRDMRLDIYRFSNIILDLLSIPDPLRKVKGG